MWYVVQVAGGQETKTCELIRGCVRAAFPDREKAARVLKECFTPTYQVEQKFSGQYKLVKRNLFPGYVVAISASVGELNTALHRTTAFTRILGNDTAFIPLDRAEMAFINSFTTSKHRVILTSRAVDEGDCIRIVEGPLVGREGWITKVNRRKGTALVETDAFGRTLQVELGLAVVSER